MEWSDVGKIAEGLLPMAGALLAPVTGGASVAAATGITAIINAFGLPKDATPETVAAAIQSTTDPDVKLKLMQAVNDYNLAMAKEENEKLKTQLADVQSARAMHTEHEKATGKTDVNLYFLSWIIVAGFFGVTALLLFVAIPENQSNVLYTLLGTLGAGFMLVLQFFYGTNRSSETKTDMIYNSTPNLPKKEA